MQDTSPPENNAQPSNHGLLPPVCKNIGMLVIMLAFAPAIIIKTWHITIAPLYKDLLKVTTLNFVVVGLLLIAFTAEKVEQEKTMALRLKSLSVAVIWGVLNLFFRPIVDFSTGSPVQDQSAQGLLISMLFFYLLIFYLQRKAK